MLLLYHPFRDPATEFLDENKSVSQFFKNWQPCNKVDQQFDFHQQHHLSIEDSLKYREEQKEREISLQCNDTDIAHHNQDDSANENQLHRIDASNIDIFYANTLNNLLTLDDTCEIMENETTIDEQVKSIALVNVEENDGNQTDNHILYSLPQCEITKNDLKQHAQNCFQAYNQILFDTNTTENRQFHVINNLHVAENRRVILKHLKDCFTLTEKTILTEVQRIEIANKPYPSFNDVSNLFNLNDKQHQAFVLFSAPIVIDVFGIKTENFPKLFHDNSPILLIGSGGAGKSLVISAIQHFFKYWGRPNCIFSLAPTGVAASNIKGKTIHNGFNIRPPIPNTLPEHIRRPSTETLDIWKQRHGLIIDEISMVDSKMFGFLLTSLYQLKETNNSQKWPHIKLLLSGDFFQLSPTSSKFIFKKPNNNSSEMAKLGYRKYHQIKNVIYLQESHRFQNDKEWGALLNEARMGIWSNDLKQILKDRFEYGIHNNIQLDHQKSKFTTTISTDNKVRHEVNNACINKIAKTLTVYKLPAIIKGANERQLAQLYQLSDDKTSRLPSILYLYETMPIKFRSNQCVPAMLANGTYATIFHIQWKPNTTFKDNGPFRIPDKPPLNIFIKIENTDMPPIKFPNIPEQWPINVMPIRRETRKINYFTNDNNAISINNYPIIPAFAVTTHLVQGLTIPKIILTEPLPKNQRPDRYSLYCAISRCPTRNGIFLTIKLTDRHFKYFIPNDDTISEDERLHTLDEHFYLRYSENNTIDINQLDFTTSFETTCEKELNSFNIIPNGPLLNRRFYTTYFYYGIFLICVFYPV